MGFTIEVLAMPASKSLKLMLEALSGAVAYEHISYDRKTKLFRSMMLSKISISMFSSLSLHILIKGIRIFQKILFIFMHALNEHLI